MAEDRNLMDKEAGEIKQQFHQAKMDNSSPEKAKVLYKQVEEKILLLG